MGGWWKENYFVKKRVVIEKEGRLWVRRMERGLFEKCKGLKGWKKVVGRTISRI